MLQAAFIGVAWGDKFRAAVHTLSQALRPRRLLTAQHLWALPETPQVHHTLNTEWLEQDAFDGQSPVDSKKDKAVLRADWQCAASNAYRCCSVGKLPSPMTNLNFLCLFSFVNKWWLYASKCVIKSERHVTQFPGVWILVSVRFLGSFKTDQSCLLAYFITGVSMGQIQGQEQNLCPVHLCQETNK